MTSEALTAKPRVLCLMQLPPPVHGVTMMNKTVAESDVLASRYAMTVIPLRFADSLEQLRRPSLRKVLRAARTGIELVANLARERPELVYFTLAPSGPAFYRDCVYVGILKLFGAPRVYHLHAAGIAAHLQSSLGRRLCEWIFDDAWVVHLSPSLRGDTTGLVPEDRVVYVANGIETTDPRGVVARQTPPRILFLSNLIRSKGPLVLLDALTLLARRGVEFEATFAGAPFHDGCADEVARRIDEPLLSRRVCNVGPVYGAAKTALFRAHDIFVLPTEQDAFPMVLLEAMQAGLPAIATAMGAIPEIIADGETGFIIPVGAADVLAERLERLLGDAELRARLGAHSRARFEQRYTVERFERNLADALARCLGDVS